MYYFLCPACNNRNDIDSDVTGQQFACGHCRHVQVVEVCYYDTPTENVPKASTIQQSQVQHPQQPQVQYNETPPAMPNPKPAESTAQVKTPKKKKRSNALTTNRMKNQKQGTKGRAKRTSKRMPVSKKQSSSLPLVLTIVGAVALILIVIIVIAGNKKPKPKKKTRTRTIKTETPEKRKKLPDNIFLDH